MLWVKIQNDGTTDDGGITGNYNVSVMVNYDCLHETRIKGYFRDDGWYNLLRIVVDKIGEEINSRNGNKPGEI